MVEDLRALFWSLPSGSVSLETLDGSSGAWGINDTGMACGFATTPDGDQRAVRWNLVDGSLIDLGTLTNPDTLQSGNESYSYRGINNAHAVVGHAEIPNNDGTFMPYHGFVYDDSDGIQDLGTLNTDSYYLGGYSIAYDINDANVVVGITNITDWDFRAFVWSEEAGMQELAVDGQRESGDWYASTINASGLIGGHAIEGEGTYPYYWPSTADLPIELGMPASYPNGELYGINANGQMVGGMFNGADAGHAFIFDIINGVVDLNACIDPFSGWELVTAVDINDLGQITGNGLVDGKRHAFMLTPTADTDADDDIDGRDMAKLGQEIGQTLCSQNCVADFNDDDAVNTIDVSLLGMVFGRTR